VRRGGLQGWATVVVAVLSWSRLAAGASLSWQTESRCPPDEFTAQLEASTERSVAELPASEIKVTLRGSGTVWQAEVTYVDQGGLESAPRSMEGGSCADVSKAAAVALALALTEDQEAPADPPEAEETGAPNEPPAPEKPIDARKKKPGPRVPLLAGLTLDTSLLGIPTLGGVLGVGLDFGVWELGLRGAALVPSEFDTTSATGIRLQGYLTGLFGCAVIQAWPLRPRVCLGYDLDIVVGQGVGEGLANAQEQTALWHALTPELGALIPLARRLDLRVGVGAAFGLSKSRFVFDSGAVAHELPSVSGRGDIALQWTP